MGKCVSRLLLHWSLLNGQMCQSIIIALDLPVNPIFNRSLRVSAESLIILTDASYSTVQIGPTVTIILEWTTRLDTSSRTLFVRDSLTQGGGCPRHVERRVT